MTCFVEAVLGRDHEAVRGEVRRERRDGALGMVGLDGQDAAAIAALEILGQEGARRDMVGRDRPRDAEPVPVHRRDMVGRRVDEAARPRRPG